MGLSHCLGGDPSQLKTDIPGGGGGLFGRFIGSGDWVERQGVYIEAFIEIYANIRRTEGRKGQRPEAGSRKEERERKGRKRTTMACRYSLSTILPRLTQESNMP